MSSVDLEVGDKVVFDHGRYRPTQDIWYTRCEWAVGVVLTVKTQDHLEIGWLSGFTGNPLVHGYWYGANELKVVGKFDVPDGYVNHREWWSDYVKKYLQ